MEQLITVLRYIDHNHSNAPLDLGTSWHDLC